MNRLLILWLSMLCFTGIKAQVHTVSGRVVDGDRKPLALVNIYIDGTLDGTSSNAEGMFAFETDREGVVKLIASFVGYETYTITREVGAMKELTVVLKPVVKQLQDVVVVAGNYSLKSSTLESQHAIGLATTGGSEGDLYKSLTMLPGTQATGTDGRLLVRGGESRESQMFIDGMHVLTSYTAGSPNGSSRSKYNTFHFEGIHFSTGGYSPEYSQSLSGILPLDTKDRGTESKYGFSLMNVCAEVGGTKAWKKGSASTTINYTDMAFYNATLHPSDKKNWDIPYRDIGVRNQLRFDLGPNTTLKTYCGYDKTRYRLWWTEPFAPDTRLMNYNEDNLYLNTTLRKKATVTDLNYFVGAAYSWNRQNIGNALMQGDAFKATEHELHLKAKAAKRFSNLYKLEVGAETYIKQYDMTYTPHTHRRVDNNISGVFISNDFNFSHRFFLNLSGRVEHATLTQKCSILPRAAVNYRLGNLTLSAVAGRYQQAAENNHLVYNEHLAMETNRMTLLGAYYTKGKRIYRAEVYNKKYTNLPLLVDGEYTSGGYGHGRGIDLYFEDREMFRKLEYTITYSYNDSKRLYLDYPEAATPQYVTRHNASVMFKYTGMVQKTLCMVGLTNRFADGRPYHNPNKAGFMNSKTSFYHTLDLSLTVLPHSKVIVYACLSNVLNRANIYGYTYADAPDAAGWFHRSPVTMNQRQAFYVGVFVTLGKNAAYSASYF